MSCAIQFCISKAVVADLYLVTFQICPHLHLYRTLVWSVIDALPSRKGHWPLFRPHIRPHFSDPSQSAHTFSTALIRVWCLIYASMNHGGCNSVTQRLLPFPGRDLAGCHGFWDAPNVNFCSFPMLTWKVISSRVSPHCTRRPEISEGLVSTNLTWAYDPWRGDM